MGIACLRTGRRYIGIEKDREHFDLAVENIRRAIDQRNLARDIDEVLLAA